MRTILILTALWASLLSVSGQHSPLTLQAFKSWTAGTIVTAEAVAQYGESRCFASEPLSNAVFGRMQGRSYPAGCRVPRASLRHVRLLHYDLDGNIRLGELVCHRDIADDLVAIFRELYRHRYSLQSVRLIDDFDADDERSMRANNTSSFCYRQIKGQTRLSAHAQGKAIDINPLYNPCWRRSRSGKVTVQPSNAMKYCDRTADFPCKIDRNDLAYRLFMQHGFKWGGAWRTVKDYQHFEK